MNPEARRSLFLASPAQDVVDEVWQATKPFDDLSPDEEYLAFLREQLKLNETIIDMMVRVGLYTLKSFVEFSLLPYEYVFDDLSPYDLTCIRSDFMLVRAFGKYVEDEMTKEGHDPLDVDLTRFEPGPFQEYVKSALRSTRREIRDACKAYGAPHPGMTGRRIPSERLRPNYMAPDNFMQGDPERTAAQVRAEPVTSNGQAGGRQDNEDRRSASNGSVFGDPEEGENPDLQNVQPDHQTSRGQTAGHQTTNQQTSNQKTSYNGAKTLGRLTRERHPFFATGGSPFGKLYRPYENIYGN
jgi:hypothetical protein